MATKFSVNVLLKDSRKVRFEDVKLGEARHYEQEGVRLETDNGRPMKVTILPPTPQDRLMSIEYLIYTDIRNYHKVIVPDSGRTYISAFQMVNFWQQTFTAAVNDFKTPLFIFTGQDGHTSLAYGIIGKPFETFMRPIEPVHKRALMVFMRRLSLMIKRGTDDYPIPQSVLGEHPRGGICEYVYYDTDGMTPGRPWLTTLRDYYGHVKRIHSLPDVSARGAMDPLWCSWTDWFSDTVTDRVILDNVREGVKLGIRNYVIDDGWFGPGLDNDADVELNLGDWQPDPSKIKDMTRLVADIKKEGARPLIWCAPHAVADGARCMEERKPFLISDAGGKPATTHNGFHVLCFRCPQAREIMASICVRLIEQWDFDGAKYDLFNCVPAGTCANPQHSHDVDSMMEGLYLTLREIDRRCRALKKDYIVELKQNYGTPFLAQWGSMMRAGDTPYNTEGNFLRTLYNNAYTPYSINDYQTITDEETPQQAAVIVLKMIAAGIPTYSIDFARLNEPNKQVIARYNAWYSSRIGALANPRIPLDPENSALRVEDGQRDIVFLVNSAGPLAIRRDTTILNASFAKSLLLRADFRAESKVRILNWFGEEVACAKRSLDKWQEVGAEPGCLLEITTQ